MFAEGDLNRSVYGALKGSVPDYGAKRFPLVFYPLHHGSGFPQPALL